MDKEWGNRKGEREKRQLKVGMLGAGLVQCMFLFDAMLQRHA